MKNEKQQPAAAGSLDTIGRRMDYQEEIDATHPMAYGPDGDLRINADTMAMELVGQRHAKRDLVDLVRWLLIRNPEGLLDIDETHWTESHGTPDGGGC